MKKGCKVEYQKMKKDLKKKKKTTQMNIVMKQPKPESGQQNFMRQKQTTTSNGVTHEEGEMTPTAVLENKDSHKHPIYSTSTVGLDSRFQPACNIGASPLGHTKTAHMGHRLEHRWTS